LALVRLVENHESCVVALEQPLQELHADAYEAVAIGHHNLCDNAATDGVQKGEKTGTLPVDAAASVQKGSRLASMRGRTGPLESARLRLRGALGFASMSRKGNLRF
jgi:ribosomal protein L16/L10AE